ncbi:MAG TPA: permease-like cell division protein FtsX [Burkholderiales bacterium]|nr:permease-like cell division protein FtsX [Burkholderiales bacterium]
MHHRQALASSFAQLFKTPFASLFTLLAIGVSLSLPAGLYLLLQNVTQIAGALPAQTEITLFMQNDAAPAGNDDIKRRLANIADIRSARFISRQAALASLSEQMGISDLASELPENPLPDAWVIIPSTSDPVALKQLAANLRTLPRVATVQADELWAKRLYALLALGRYMLVMLAIILAVALVSISGNTIRLQILTRHAEIEVSRLIGATYGYIRRPFLYFGALQGLLGGLIAWLAIRIALVLLEPRMAAVSQLYASRYRLQMLSVRDVALLLAISGAIGWLGAYLSVGRTLAQIEKTP